MGNCIDMLTLGGGLDFFVGKPLKKKVQLRLSSCFFPSIYIWVEFCAYYEGKLLEFKLCKSESFHADICWFAGLQADTKESYDVKVVKNKPS